MNEKINISIDYFLNMVDIQTRYKVAPIIEYIENVHGEAIFDKDYSAKTMIPTWRKGNSFVKIGCRKSYISIYFSNRNSVDFIKENFKFCRGLKSCVNLSYKREIPYNIINKAIDISFE